MQRIEQKAGFRPGFFRLRSKDMNLQVQISHILTNKAQNCILIKKKGDKQHGT